MPRLFRGRADSRRISLYRLFPRSEIVFSTPFAESDKIHRLVVEGEPASLDALGEYLRRLALKEYIEERAFGRWYGFGPHETTGGLVVYYDTFDKPVNQYQLLVFVLRRHLVKFCNLRLTEVSVIRSVLDGKQVLEENIGLSPDIGNGTIELPLGPPAGTIITN